MWQRIFSIIVKEFIQIMRDQRTLIIILAMPLIQMIMFGYVFGTDIKHTSMVVWDASNTAESRDLIQSFRETDTLSLNYYARNYDEITQLIESGDVKIALVIPPDYATKLNRRERRRPSSSSPTAPSRPSASRPYPAPPPSSKRKALRS